MQVSKPVKNGGMAQMDRQFSLDGIAVLQKMVFRVKQKIILLDQEKVPRCFINAGHRATRQKPG
jgi:hypothetical protein